MTRFNVERSIQIAASCQQVFDTVADYSGWTKWSPWLCAEPDARVTVTDEPAEVGSVYAWEGEVVGAGEIEHIHLAPPNLIQDEIRFLKPFRSKSRVSFELEPTGNETRLTWGMQGSLPWFMFWMRPMMETLIGMDYDRGLKMLKEWIETGSIESQTRIHGVTSTGPLSMLGVSGACTISEISKHMEEAFRQAESLFQERGLSTDEGMISVYHDFNMKTGIFKFTSGYLVSDSDRNAKQAGGLTGWSTPETQALYVEHVGSYQHLGNAWSAANQIARYKKLKPCKSGAFELYKTTPPAPSAELRTEIYLPLR